MTKSEEDSKHEEAKQGFSKRIDKQSTKVYERERRSEVKAISERDFIDRRYFEGYSKLDIHREMLADQRRIDVYREAIVKTVKGMTVVDVGAGTGILSMLAAEAGAERVYAVERSDIVRECKKLVRANGQSSVIKIMNILAEDAPLTAKSADVIVSEWMGYFLLYERMMPCVMNVRDKCLKPGGIMIPGRVKLFLAASNHKPEGDSIELVPELDPASSEPLIIDIPSGNLISDAHCILDLNLLDVGQNFDSFSATFSLPTTQEDVFRGLVGWFDAEMIPGQWFSTSPFDS